MIHEVNGWEEDDDDGLGIPVAFCPRCKAEHEDFDGFGVLNCACGYCAHPSATDGKCDLCGEPEGQPK